MIKSVKALPIRRKKFVFNVLRHEKFKIRRKSTKDDEKSDWHSNVMRTFTDLIIVVRRHKNLLVCFFSFAYLFIFQCIFFTFIFIFKMYYVLIVFNHVIYSYLNQKKVTPQCRQLLEQPFLMQRELC